MENGGAKVMMKNGIDDPLEESKEVGGGRANWDQIAMSMSHKISDKKRDSGADDEMSIMAADPQDLFASNQ